MTQFLGEIRSFGFNFAPRGWAFCEGQLLPISQNTALFSLLGTSFGGDGRTTFGLPDLRSRRVVGSGGGAGLSPYVNGDRGGVEAVAVSIGEIPVHSHQATVVTDPGTVRTPVNAVPAGAASHLYATTHDTTMVALQSSGGGQPHENRPPFLVLNYCISLVGIFPARS